MIRKAQCLLHRNEQQILSLILIWMVLPGVPSLPGLNAVPSMLLDLYTPSSLVSELGFTYVSIGCEEKLSCTPAFPRDQQQLQPWARHLWY